MRNIVIATAKSWNLEMASDFMEENKDKYNIVLVQDADIFRAVVSNRKDMWIFLPHWSWIIPKEIWENNRCVAFHIGDLPNGRGGSPVQNLILRKIYDTQLTAFRINETIDGGDIYMKRPISLKEGSVEDILRKASKIIFKEMIPYIIEKDTPPISQIGGKVLEFKRRTPDESDLNLAGENIEDIYDYIRMLDGEGYPKAFLKFGGRYQSKRIFLSDAKFTDGKLMGKFEIE